MRCYCAKNKIRKNACGKIYFSLSPKRRIYGQSRFARYSKMPGLCTNTEGLLVLVKESWLVCQDCDRKYPIVEDIPVMLIDEGDKWVTTAQNDLPVPPTTHGLN